MLLPDLRLIPVLRCLFVSYGLTSLISLFIGMGLVLNVGLQSSAYNKELQKKEQKKDAYFRKEEYL